MISQTAEYALRAVIFLADHEGESHTAHAISSVTQVPTTYLSKILQSLARAHLVTSQRGPHGGFHLTKSPDEVTVYEVVQIIDPIQRITQCPLGISEHGTNLCGLHRLLDSTALMIERQFRKVTITGALSCSAPVRAIHCVLFLVIACLTLWRPSSGLGNGSGNIYQSVCQK